MLFPVYRTLAVLALVVGGLSALASGEESNRWFDLYGRADVSFTRPTTRWT